MTGGQGAIRHVCVSKFQSRPPDASPFIRSEPNPLKRLKHLPTLVLRSSPLGSANLTPMIQRELCNTFCEMQTSRMQTPPNERGRKVKRPLNRGIRKKSVRKKSVRFASTTFNEPISTAANEENREGSSSSGAGSGVETAVLVAQYAACVTAFIDPVVR